MKRGGRRYLMRDVTRIEPMLEELKSVWEQYPDLRLGQLICDIVPEEKLFYIEDDLMLERIKKWKK